VTANIAACCPPRCQAQTLQVSALGVPAIELQTWTVTLSAAL